MYTERVVSLGPPFPSKLHWVRLDVARPLQLHTAVPARLATGVVSRAQLLDAVETPSESALLFYLLSHPIGVTGRADARRVVSGLASWRMVCVYQQRPQGWSRRRDDPLLEIPVLHFPRLSDEQVARLALLDTWMSLIVQLPAHSQAASLLSELQSDLAKDGSLADLFPRLKSRAALSRLLDRSGLPPLKSKKARVPLVGSAPASSTGGDWDVEGDQGQGDDDPCTALGQDDA